MSKLWQDIQAREWASGDPTNWRHFLRHTISKRRALADAPLDALIGATPRDTGRNIPVKVRWAVWKRDNFTCQYCGAREFLSVDHIYPWSWGGPLIMDNLQTLCKSCNSRKGANT